MVVQKKQHHCNNNYIDKCATHYLQLIKELLSEGEIKLNERYILNNNQLVETKNTLSAHVIKAIEANDQYFLVSTSYTMTELTKITGSQFVFIYRYCFNASIKIIKKSLKLFKPLNKILSLVV